MKKELLKTGDGSFTIHISELDENYHSGHGALQEALHVFIQNGLKTLAHKEEVNIFEMGFGTGLNALLTMAHTGPGQRVNYTGIEAFPVEKEIVSALGYDQLVDQEFRHLFSLIHDAKWGQKVSLTPLMTLTKLHERIEEHQPEREHFDLIYFDAFGPRAQNEMWQIDILKKMSDMLRPGGIFVTYCAKGQVKRDLRSLGFEVEALPGPPGKREMTRATKK